MDQTQLPTAPAASPAAEAIEAPASVAPGENAAPVQETPTVNWDSDENPYYGRVRELETKAEKAARLEQENEAFKRLMAQASMKAENDRRARIRTDFDEGRIDSAEYHRRMEEAIQQRDQWWQQQMVPYHTRDYADQVAQQHGLTAEERQELYGLDGHAIDFAAREIVNRRNYVPAAKVSELESRLDQLQRSMAANQIANSGVTQTLQGNPSAAGEQPKGGTMEDLRAILQRRHPELYQQRRAG